MQSHLALYGVLVLSLLNTLVFAQGCGDSTGTCYVSPCTTPLASCSSWPECYCNSGYCNLDGTCVPDIPCPTVVYYQSSGNAYSLASQHPGYTYDDIACPLLLVSSIASTTCVRGGNWSAIPTCIPLFTTASTTSSSSSSVGPIVGGVVGGCVLLAVVILALVYLRRCRKPHVYSSHDTFENPMQDQGLLHHNTEG